MADVLEILSSIAMPSPIDYLIWMVGVPVMVGFMIHMFTDN